MADQHEESAMDTIRHLKHRDPFTPFRVVMSSGDDYVIADPDALAIATSQIHYYPPQKGGGVHLRVNQIVAVEESD